MVRAFPTTSFDTKNFVTPSNVQHNIQVSLIAAHEDGLVWSSTEHEYLVGSLDGQTALTRYKNKDIIVRPFVINLIASK